MTTWQKLTDEEEAVLNLLGEAWSKFRQLPKQHPTHNTEMMYAIHQAQRLILARVGSRSLGYLPAILEVSQKDDPVNKADAPLDGVELLGKPKPSGRRYVIRPDDVYALGSPQEDLRQIAGMVSVHIDRQWIIGYQIDYPYTDDMCIVMYRGNDAEITSDQWRGYFMVNLLEFRYVLRQSTANDATALARLIKKLAAQIGVEDRAGGGGI